MLKGNEYAKDLNDMVIQVEEAMNKFGNNTAAITRSIRTSGFARQSACDTFGALASQLKLKATEVRKNEPVRRKIFKGK